MKKTILVLAALLIMSSAAFAGGGLEFSLGPKVGYQTATLSYKKADIQSGFANHFAAGIFGRVGIGSFYVQPEVLYFKTSSMFDVDFTGTGSDNIFNIPTGANVGLTLNSMNLQVPVLVGFTFLDLDLVSFRAQVGPTANFVIKSTQLWNYSTEGNNENKEFDGKELVDPQSISWGMQAGVGVDVLGFLTLDVNYNFGLSKMFKALDASGVGSQYFNFGNMDTSKQSLFMVTLGVKLL